VTGEYILRTNKLALLTFGMAAALSAAQIPIQNASFEANVLNAGCPGQQTYGSCTNEGQNNPAIIGWTGSSPVPADAGSEWNYGVYAPSSVSYTGALPNGTQVAYLQAIADNVSISQTLSATLLSNDTYTLTVDVGERSDRGVLFPGINCSGFNVSLTAGGNVLSDLNPSCNTLSYGTFTQFTLTYSSGANPAGLGSALGIVLEANGSGSPYEPSEIDFDNVTLSDTTTAPITAVPEPSALGLLCLGFSGAAIFLRRKKSSR
jgi:hypothetical protein